MKRIKSGAFIALLSCLVFSFVKTKENQSKGKILLDGLWMSRQNHKETIRICKDSLQYFYEGKADAKLGLKILDSVWYENRMIKSNKGESLFVLSEKSGISDICYLLGVNKNEFSIMYLSNGQTLVYKRIKK